MVHSGSIQAFFTWTKKQKRGRAIQRELFARVLVTFNSAGQSRSEIVLVMIRHEVLFSYKSMHTVLYTHLFPFLFRNIFLVFREVDA